ncbi:hypothetical protein [Ruminococcus albus]|uniref:hypothetical protein n=1 Tax=Ruminococcus albus TaxID=1264 RepID=UPI0004665F03|nr:hypothetical protein [Ruminococcus albus]
MITYYKCSFRSSYGYRTVKYDFSNNKSVAVNDDEIPEAIYSLLNIEQKHNMILATDGNGIPLLGVFGMEDENDEKYVNAVFFDPNNAETIISLYHSFSKNYYGSIQAVIQSVERLSCEDQQSGLEYRITPDCFFTGIEIDVSEKESMHMNTMPSKQLVAFVSDDSFDDYKLQIERCFSVQSVCAFNHISVKSGQIDGYEMALLSLYKRSKKTVSSVMVIGLIVVIICVLITLLVVYYID